MPVVDVVGVGEVEFPDEFTPEQIRDVLRNKFAEPQSLPTAGSIPYPADLEATVQAEQEFDAPPPTSNRALDLMRSVPAGIAENALLAGQGMGKMISTLPVPGMIAEAIGPERTGEARDIARSVQERAAEDYGVDPARAGEFPRKLVQGITSTVPVIAAGPAAPIVGGAIAGESARQDAEEAGATPLQQDIAFFGNAAVGAVTEQLLGVPKILKIAREAGGGENIAKSIVARAAVAWLKSGASESTQEGLQTFAENWIARDIATYDPKRSLQQNVGESAVIGGLVGGALGGTVATAEALTQRPTEAPPAFPEAEAPTMTPISYDPDTGFVAAGGQVYAPDASGRMQVVPRDSAKGKAARSLVGEEAVTPSEPVPEAPAPAVAAEPTVETPTAAPTTPEPTAPKQRTIAGPAIAFKGEATPRVKGTIGQTHMELIMGAGEDLSDADTVFHDGDGKIVETREEAWEIAEAAGQIKPDVLKAKKAQAERTKTKPKLNSEDLITPPAAAPAQEPEKSLTRDASKPEQMTPDEYAATEPKSDGIRDEFVAKNGSIDVHVVKNPTPKDYQRINDEHDRLYPNDKSGDPKTRFTIDSNGNRYIWPAADAMHSSIEWWLKENKGITANQNTQFFSQRYHIGRAMFSKKPINAKAFDAQNFPLPEGYVREGELYVFREPTATPTPEPATTPAEAAAPEISYTEPAVFAGPLSDLSESLNVRLDGPSRVEKGQLLYTDRISGNTFSLPASATPDQIVEAVNSRRRKYGHPEAALPEAFRGTTESLPFSPIEKSETEITPESEVPVSDSGTGVPPPPVTPPPTAAPDPSRDPLGIRNSIVDKKRAERGLPPRMAALKRSFGFLWNTAMQAVEADSAAGSKLIAAMAKNPRPLEDWETALLTHEMVVRENDYEDAVDKVNDAKDEASRERAQEELATAADRNQEAYDVFDSVGTKSGQSLNARKIVANRDFSRARMVAETRAVVNNGGPLSEEQKTNIEKLANDLKETRTKLAAAEARIEAFEQQRVFKLLAGESKVRAKEVKAAAKQGKTVLDLLAEKRDAAMKRIIDRRGKLNVTIDPLNIAGLVDEAIIGSYYIAKGLRDFTQWSAQMLKDFGERISPYLPELFNQSQQYHDANAKLFTAEDVVTKAKADAAAGTNLNPKHVFDLARQKVNQGMKDLHNVMASVTEDLKAAYPDITEREVRDAFSGYGKVRYPSKEEDKTKLRELRRLGQLVSSIEDAVRKIAPKRSGMQRDAPTQDVREKMLELREAMKENDIQTTSPDEQLKSVNAARATALRNQIADIDKQLRTGQKPKRGAKVPDSAEVERLRSERDAMKDLVKEIEEAQNPKLTPEQRQLAKDKRAIQRRIDTMKEKIAKGDYTKQERRPPQMDKEKRDLQFEEAKIKEKFYRGLIEAELKKRSPVRKAWDGAMNVLGLLRAMKLSIDLGAFGRQGGFLGRGNPVRAMRALRAGLRSMRSEQNHYNQMRDIWERENAPLYKSSKLFIPDPKETKLSRLEEEYMSTLTRHIPGLAGSERGHVMLLSQLRADSFDAIINSHFGGKPTAKQARQVAAFVNICTGRGELGRFAAGVPAANLFLNATSYYASRIQLLGNMARVVLPGKATGLDPKVAQAMRAEILKGVAGNIVYYGLMAAAAKLLWPEETIELQFNPTSSDFGKIRVGKIVIDPLMGLSQYVTLLSRIITGEMKTKAGTLNLREPKFGGPTIGTTIGRFAQDRLSPNARTFLDFFQGYDYDKRKVSPLVAAENTLPISIKETYELYRAAGYGPGTALTVAMLLGDGVRVEQDYPGPLHSLLGEKPTYVKPR